MPFYRIKNWGEFQHYKDRAPPWIKLHRSMLTSRTWVSASDSERTLAIACMLIAADTDNKIPDDPAYVRRVAYLNCDPDFKSLLRSQFIELVDENGSVIAGAIEPLAKRTECSSEERRDRAEKSRGEKTSVELKLDRGPVERIFEHWRSEFRHPKAGLDPKRRRAIQRSLEAYDEDTLKAAISGYKLSPHHMGQNDQRTVYDDINLFLRDAEHIDRGLNFARAPPVAAKSAVEIARENLRKNINGNESRVVSEQPGRPGDSSVGSLARLLR